MDSVQLSAGGAPLLGEPLPLELANTTYAVRSQLRDGLETVEHLAGWLRDVAGRLGTPLRDRDLAEAGTADLAVARDLRQAIRLIAQATVTGDQPPSAAIDDVNQVIRTAPSWRELRWAAEPSTITASDHPPVAAALAEIAMATVDLFAGPDRAALRPCQGPGCVLYFVKQHPRREWCSGGCGNRARAARYYERTKTRAG
ncbi:CGNR zinc finger domain-containing protein [Micromonospora polyrhachis]|uniref:Putative RNA-binding Zn ribbon-like protein n=1 Tax=Micromonospora polyrhachis TaxID=1282883 RepID=A0A7W7ST28_9ACTN|nr:ABATE domain-containing protein [Micromonospora polyrhachis]MBB4960472.1 putative RNA-binding Zn ribbon-like protein [Micromonospora polyrhachis]